MGATPYFPQCYQLVMVFNGPAAPRHLEVSQHFRGFAAKRREGAEQAQTTVTKNASKAAPAASLPAKTKGNSISRVTTKAAASAPAATPKIAVARPIRRYSNA